MILFEKEFFVSLNEHPNFDVACRIANFRASSILEIDENGHSSIENWERSNCYIKVDFLRYTSRISHTQEIYTYYFSAKAIKEEEE